MKNIGSIQMGVEGYVGSGPLSNALFVVEPSEVGGYDILFHYVGSSELFNYYAEDDEDLLAYFSKPKADDDYHPHAGIFADAEWGKEIEP